MTKHTQLKRVLAILVSVALLVSCISIAGWTVAAAETVWTFEDETIGQNLSLFTTDTMAPSTEENHTEGGSKSVKVTSTQNFGNDRAQMIIMDGNGNAVTVAKDEIVQVSFWVYLPTQSAYNGNLRMWLTATNNDAVHSSANPKNDAVVYEPPAAVYGRISGIPENTWHQVSVTTNGAYAGKLRLGIAGDKGTTTFYIDDITVTREDAPEIKGTAYHYTFDENDGKYYNDSNGDYYGTVGVTSMSHNNTIKSNAEASIVENGTGYAMQMAYTGNLNSTNNQQEYAAFSLPNNTGATKNNRAAGKSIYLEKNAVFQITVKYKVESYVSPATLYIATYSGDNGSFAYGKTFSTEFANHAQVARITEATTGWNEVSAFHFPADNGNACFVLKMDDDTNRNGTKVIISEITITPVASSTITFDMADGSNVATVAGAVGQTITYPADPTKSGHEFLGWMTVKGNQAPTAFPAEDTVLVARWKAIGSTVIDMENLAVDARQDLNGKTNGWNTNNYIKVSDFTNITVGGEKALEFGGTDASSMRAQMMVKDSTGAQVNVVAGKNYRLSFWYYVPVSEGDYDLNYWFAANDNEDRFNNEGNSIEGTVLAESSTSIANKGVWTQVVVNVNNCPYSGKLRFGACSSTAASSARYTLYVDDIAISEVEDVVIEPNTQTFEAYSTGKELDIKANYPDDTITVSTEYNHTEGGAQSAKFLTNDHGGGSRVQMMVKDGNDDNITLEAGKDYTLSFWYYVPVTQDNFTLSYWFAVTEDEVCFTAGVQKDNAKIAEETQVINDVKGDWNRVTISITDCLYTGKLRFGACGTDSNYHTRIFYIDDIVVKERVPFVPDPEVESFEIGAPGTEISIPSSTGNKIVISADENATVGGSQSAMVTSSTKSGGGRAQMLVKDGEGNQVIIEKDAYYIITFKYFIPENEPDFVVNYWLTADDSEDFYTAGGQKDAVRLYEYSSKTSSDTPDTKGQWNEVTISIPKAAHGGKLRMGLCDNTGALVHYYIDDIKVFKASTEVAPDPDATKWDFENYLPGMGSNLFVHGSGSVSNEFNHTEGGEMCLAVNRKTNYGIDRPQFVVMNQKTGKPYELKKGETYNFSVWCYKPSTISQYLNLNLWLMTTDTIEKITDKSNADFDMGSYTVKYMSDFWTEYKVTFTAKNGKYLIMGVADHYNNEQDVGVMYFDDFYIEEPEYMTVKFDTNGSEDKYGDIIGMVGDLIPVDENWTDPYREGYEFTGWYTKKTCDKDSLFDITSDVLEGKNGDVLTLYAGWQEWDDSFLYDESEVIEKEEKEEYRTEYYEEKVWVGDNNVPKPLDIGERPEAELETITDLPVDEDPGKDDPAQDGLPTWLIIVIIAAAVLVVGGGALAALLLSKKAKTTEENNA